MWRIRGALVWGSELVLFLFIMGVLVFIVKGLELWLYFVFVLEMGVDVNLEYRK